MLQICLRCAIAAKLPPDLLLHSAGIVHDGMVYLFSGKSGAGKSTVCKLLAQDSSFIILHDDMVAIAQTQEIFRAWSTPLSGEMPAGDSMGAPLQAVFFLKHDLTNYVTSLSRRKAAGLLALNLVPPLVARNDSLVNQPAESIEQLLMLTERIPCYELHFRPERSFWDCIPKVFEAESVTPMGKG
jgi:energy-coupling factor transporter ATP-binding protein EcfA2